MVLNFTLRLLVLADQRKLQMVVRNYAPTALKVAGDITQTDSNYTFRGFELHVENGMVAEVMPQATTSPEVNRKQR